MPISDMNPTTVASASDAICAAKLQKSLKRAVRMARQLVGRATALVAEAPGGKAAVNTELSATQAEASAILDKLAAIVAAHKATGSADVTNPLL